MTRPELQDDDVGPTIWDDDEPPYDDMYTHFYDTAWDGEDGPPESPRTMGTQASNMDRSIVDDEQSVNHTFEDPTLNFNPPSACAGSSGVETSCAVPRNQNKSQNSDVPHSQEFIDDYYVDPNIHDMGPTKLPTNRYADVSLGPVVDNDFWVGQIFKSRDDFKNALCDMAVRSKKELKSDRFTDLKVV